MMRLRVVAIVVIAAGLTAVVAGSLPIGLGCLVVGVVAFIRSLRPGGFWRKPDDGGSR
jgi:hypothetical protein